MYGQDNSVTIYWLTEPFMDKTLIVFMLSPYRTIYGYIVDSSIIDQLIGIFSI